MIIKHTLKVRVHNLLQDTFPQEFAKRLWSSLSPRA